MPEVEEHLAAAAEALAAAQLLLGQGFYPDAASRAYYAMLHAARAAHGPS